MVYKQLVQVVYKRDPRAEQREACEAYLRSQQHERWVLARTRYDDGGFSGGNLERPALQRFSLISGPAGSTSSSSTRSTG